MSKKCCAYGDFLVLSDGLLILVLVHRSLENTNVVVGNIREDLRGYEPIGPTKKTGEMFLPSP